MTGFGSFETIIPSWGKISVELRSTNHKFLEIVLHLPEGSLSMEERIKKAIETKIKRGRVTCALNASSRNAGSVFINKALLKKYITTDLLKIKDGDKNSSKVDIKIEAVKEPNLDARLVAAGIADQLAKRMPTKRVMKQTVERVMTAGAKGVKVRIGGRINGAEIARVEHEQAGILPLSSIKEKIDFAAVPAFTRSGYVGVKVWICLSDYASTSTKTS